MNDFMKDQLALLFPQVPKEHCKQVPKKVEKQVKAFSFQFHFPIQFKVQG